MRAASREVHMRTRDAIANTDRTFRSKLCFAVSGVNLFSCDFALVRASQRGGGAQPARSSCSSSRAARLMRRAQNRKRYPPSGLRASALSKARLYRSGASISRVLGTSGPTTHPRAHDTGSRCACMTSSVALRSQSCRARVLLARFCPRGGRRAQLRTISFAHSEGAAVQHRC